MYTVEPLLRGHPDERSTPLERPLDNVNLNRKVLIFTPDERPPLSKGHFSGAKGVASKEGFHCIFKSGAGVVQRLCNGLPRDSPGFDSRWEWSGVKTELHILYKGQLIGVPSLNDLAVDWMLNTTNQPTYIQFYKFSKLSGIHVHCIFKIFFKVKIISLKN